MATFKSLKKLKKLKIGKIFYPKDGLDAAATEKAIWKVIGESNNDDVKDCEPRVTGTITIPPMLEAQNVGCQAVFTGKKIYVWSARSSSVQIFDLSSQKWKTDKIEFKTEFSGPASFLYEKKIISVGDHVRIYDPETKQLSILSKVPVEPISHFSAVCHEDKIYVIGGVNAWSEKKIQIFDLKTRKWTEGPPLPDVKPSDHFHYVVSLNDQIHVLGGSSSPGKHRILVDDHWITKKDFDVGFIKFAAFGVVKNKFFAFRTESKRNHQYNPKTDTWNSIAPLEHFLCLPAAVSIGKYLVVIGGLAVDAQPASASKKIYLYDTLQDKWTDRMVLEKSTVMVKIAK